MSKKRALFLIAFAFLIILALVISALLTFRGVYIVVTTGDPASLNWSYASGIVWVLSVLAFQVWKRFARHYKEIQ